MTIKKGSKEIIMKLFGALKGAGIDWYEKERNMKEFRKDFEERCSKENKQYKKNPTTPNGKLLFS
ncbi:hypothetical protein HYU13_06115 [Candidatus Woesearchaeota archaeon]|nr:hypothetical protein [Candidatus Woesearchaeota archaeon]